MAKGLNKEYTVNLAFTADTNSAKQQLQDLQNSLTKLVNTSAFKNKDFGLDKDLQNASAAAARLKVELDNAINTDTGKLDLTKFMDSLKRVICLLKIIKISYINQGLMEKRLLLN